MYLFVDFCKFRNDLQNVRFGFTELSTYFSTEEIVDNVYNFVYNLGFTAFCCGKLSVFIHFFHKRMSVCGIAVVLHNAYNRGCFFEKRWKLWRCCAALPENDGRQSLVAGGQLRIQQNILSGHYRLLDGEDCRVMASFERECVEKCLAELLSAELY